MRLRTLFLCILLVAAFRANASQDGPLVFRIVYPPEKPPAATPAQATPVPQKSSTEMTRDAAARRQRLFAAKQWEDAQARFVRELYRHRALQQPCIDPAKDDYARYLREKQLREEAANDPEIAEIRAKYRDDSVRNDFLAWKKTQPAKKDPLSAAASKPFDIFKFLTGSFDSPASPAKKPARDEIKEE